jgi:predicted dehydrogenase
MYNVLIIGAGSIGAMKPDEYDSPTTENILTHAHAAYANTKTVLKGIVDINKDAAYLAGEKWKCKSSQCIDDFCCDEIDIVIVSCNTENHAEMVLEAEEKLNPKFFIVEKPFCFSHDEASKIGHLNHKIAVNYLRRYETYHRHLIHSVNRHVYGEVYSAIFKYVRGLERDGCHAINLIQALFGNICNYTKISSGKNDYSDNDLTDSYLFETKGCKNVMLIGCDGREYDIFEFDLICEKAIISLKDHGLKIETRIPEKEKIYGNYKSIEPFGKVKDTYLSKSLENVLGNVVNYLDGLSELYCSAKDAIDTRFFIDYLRGKF